MRNMTTPTATALSRILLVGEPSRPMSGRYEPAIRRYRLARLRINARTSGSERYAYLRRCYD
jgi:hypothetical protein